MMLSATFVAFQCAVAVSEQETLGAGSWTKLTTTGDGPLDRSKPGAAAIGDSVHIFGRVTDDFVAFTNTFYNDLHRFDTITNHWTELDPSGPLPAPRAFPATAARKWAGEIVIFGGSDFDPTVQFVTSEDVWQLDLVSLTWTDVTPDPVDDIDVHGNLGASTIIGNKLYVQGGDVPGGDIGCGAPFPQNATDELWEFHLVQHRWRQCVPGGDPLIRLKRQAALPSTACSMSSTDSIFSVPRASAPVRSGITMSTSWTLTTDLGCPHDNGDRPS